MALPSLFHTGYLWGFWSLEVVSRVPTLFEEFESLLSPCHPVTSSLAMLQLSHCPVKQPESCCGASRWRPWLFTTFQPPRPGFSFSLRQQLITSLGQSTVPGGSAHMRKPCVLPSRCWLGTERLCDLLRASQDTQGMGKYVSHGGSPKFIGDLILLSHASAH